MAEVLETESLRIKVAGGGPGSKLSRAEWQRLEELTTKEREANGS